MAAPPASAPASPPPALSTGGKAAVFVGIDSNPGRVTASPSTELLRLPELPLAPSQVVSVVGEGHLTWRPTPGWQLWLRTPVSTLLSTGVAPADNRPPLNLQNQRGAYGTVRLQSGVAVQHQPDVVDVGWFDTVAGSVFVAPELRLSLLPGLEWEDEDGHRLPLAPADVGDALALARARLRAGAVWQSLLLRLTVDAHSQVETLSHHQVVHRWPLGAMTLASLSSSLHDDDSADGAARDGFVDVGHRHQLEGQARLHLAEMLPSIPLVDELDVQGRASVGAFGWGTLEHGRFGVPVVATGGGALAAWGGRLTLDGNAGLTAVVSARGTQWDIVGDARGALGLLDGSLVLGVRLSRELVPAPHALAVSVNTLRFSSQFSFHGLAAAGNAGFATTHPLTDDEGWLPSRSRLFPDGWLFSSAQIQLPTTFPLLLSVRVELRASDAVVDEGARAGRGYSYARLFFLVGSQLWD